MTSSGYLESYFARFRRHVIGQRQTFRSAFGEKEIFYADWTATGKAYKPIEDLITRKVMPFLANTHTATTVTGTLMSKAYEEAKAIVKKHVHANNEDALIFCGSGMTGAVNKLQRILGLRVPERMLHHLKSERNSFEIDEELRPVVFITHMEHHSNHVSWLETIATVEIIPSNDEGNVDLSAFEHLLKRYTQRKNKIAAVTACSNVTGIETPWQAIAKMIHHHEGFCFVDFACSAPYVEINMHYGEGSHLDAIYFSPHKFLGAPGTPGVLIFNTRLYNNCVPDHPGGGTVVYSNPWRGREYTSDIEQREDGGTPPFLQAIKVAMAIRLKEAMGTENILRREKELLQIMFQRFSSIKNVVVLESRIKVRLGVIAFVIPGAHYNLVVKILNDRFGIQTRGGCSCAGTYGHYLLGVAKKRSHEIAALIRSGNLLAKPGWIRLSVHPIMTDSDVNFIMDAIEETALHFEDWKNHYEYEAVTNEFTFKGFCGTEDETVQSWFTPNVIAEGHSLTQDLSFR